MVCDMVYILIDTVSIYFGFVGLFFQGFRDFSLCHVSESSSNGYGGLTRDVITFDCFKRAGSVHRDSLDSQPTDRIEEAYRRLLAV